MHLEPFQKRVIQNTAKTTCDSKWQQRDSNAQPLRS